MQLCSYAVPFQAQPSPFWGSKCTHWAPSNSPAMHSRTPISWEKLSKKCSKFAFFQDRKITWKNISYGKHVTLLRIEKSLSTYKATANWNLQGADHLHKRLRHTKDSHVEIPSILCVLSYTAIHLINSISKTHWSNKRLCFNMSASTSMSIPILLILKQQSTIPRQPISPKVQKWPRHFGAQRYHQEIQYLPLQIHKSAPWNFNGILGLEIRTQWKSRKGSLFLSPL